MKTGPRVDRLRTTMRKSTSSERARAGIQARERRPRSSLAAFDAAPDRADPVELLASQETARLPLLLPNRRWNRLELY